MPQQVIQLVSIRKDRSEDFNFLAQLKNGTLANLAKMNIVSSKLPLKPLGLEYILSDPEYAQVWVVCSLIHLKPQVYMVLSDAL